MQRRPDESFEDYRIRRKADQAATRKILKGQYFFVSRSAPFVAKNTPGARDGDIVYLRRTYRKPTAVSEKCS